MLIRSTPFLLFTTLFISAFSTVKAQESIVPDISYAYIDKLVATAQKNYPEVQARTYQTTIAKSGIGKAQVGYLEALNLSYYYRPNTSVDIVNPNLFNGYQIGINLNVGTILERPFAVKEARAQYKVAQLAETQISLNLTERVKEKYFAYLEQRAQLKIRTQSFTDAQTLVKQLRYKFEKGESTLDDYQRAVLNTTEQNQSLVHAETGVFTTKAALEELLGVKLESIK
ncbi:TolC family protein [Mucilaginibacter ginkgonis]|uniref:TolC family protein n=1 Tax=Mucilaginibacter ginkgonis TaxID=2682091 RepID=A0A6I4I166_9SPHI|nr:TolC family protein [Mucilaginibacter ginkgonis]QQL51240.1 TolC family protein [Mucilaginibacter ginkgonis]